MHDWLFSDIGLLFFTAWSVVLAAVGYAAFGHDWQPVKATLPLRNESVPRVASPEGGGR